MLIIITRLVTLVASTTVVPANALLGEDNNPILTEDGNYILVE